MSEQTQSEVSAVTPEIPNNVSPKTPMYEAMHAERYSRQDKIKEIQKQTGNVLLCYVCANNALINRDDIVGMVELLHNVPDNKNVDLLLHTGGGDIDATEKLVSIIRTRVGTGQFRVIVPDFAKSAGTLIAIAADKIVMSDTSELGPIDPQIRLADGKGNSISHSVLSYLDAYNQYTSALRANPMDVAAQIMLGKLEPATVNLFDAVRLRALKLAEKHLNQWMFHNKKATYTKIAADLMDIKLWPTHGQLIDYQAAKATLDLEVEYLTPQSQEWDSFWRLYCRQRLAIKDGQKLFESDCASLSL